MPLLGFAQCFQMGTNTNNTNGKDVYFQRPEIIPNRTNTLGWQCITCGNFPNPHNDPSCQKCGFGFMEMWTCFCYQLNVCGLETHCRLCGTKRGETPTYDLETRDLIRRKQVPDDDSVNDDSSTVPRSVHVPGDQCNGCFKTRCARVYR